MAVLASGVRTQIWRGLMRYWSSVPEGVAINKFDLSNAVHATDQWIDDNGGAFNTALPIAARNNLTAAQKTLLFCAVALMRVSPAFARTILGEID